jgi:hypothetical protein
VCRDPEQLSPSSRPLRFNLHHSLHSGNIVTEAAPRPLLRTRHKSSPHRIAMKVPQLLDALSLGPDVEVVIACLPERPALNLPQLPRDILFQHLQRDRQPRSLRLGHQQVNMLRHDHISRNVESILLPRPLQSLLEDVPGSWPPQPSLAPVAAKREKVQTARFLKSLETPRHGFNRKPISGTPVCDREIFSFLLPGMGNMERKSNPPPCLCQPRRDKDGAPPISDLALNLKFTNPDLRRAGAPSLSLRSLEGQGGDFDFARARS